MVCFGQMLARLLLLCSLGLVPSPSSAASAIISADQWASPRSGTRVAQLPGLGELIADFDPAAAQIVIHYAPGETGTLWAEELRSWLVALGVPSSRISLRGTLEHADRVRVETEPR